MNIASELNNNVANNASQLRSKNFYAPNYIPSGKNKIETQSSTNLRNSRLQLALSQLTIANQSLVLNS